VKITFARTQWNAFIDPTNLGLVIPFQLINVQLSLSDKTSYIQC